MLNKEIDKFGELDKLIENIFKDINENNPICQFIDLKIFEDVIYN